MFHKDQTADIANHSAHQLKFATLKLKNITKNFTLTLADMSGPRRDLAVAYASLINEQNGALQNAGLDKVADALRISNFQAYKFSLDTLQAVEAARQQDAELTSDLKQGAAAAWANQSTFMVDEPDEDEDSHALDEKAA